MKTKPTVVDQAVDWLYGYLNSGPVDRADITRDSPFSETTLYRAADRLQVISTNTPTMPRRSIWRLPTTRTTEAPTTHYRVTLEPVPHPDQPEDTGAPR
jgi:hypothetical protein